MNNTIVILQERMAGWLMFNRLAKLDEKKDLKNPNRNIYIFRDTDRLRECMGSYDKYKNII